MKTLTTLCKPYANVVIVTDSNVGSLHAASLQQKLSAHIITIPAGEQYKTRETKAWIEDQLLEKQCGRDTILIALGGGVVTDITGFVAATYCRGVPVIYIPTSLLAMVDASIGGKTSVNTSHGKNLIGTFTKPMAVITDIAFLETLPDTEYVSAFSEIIKHALIADKDYFSFIENNVAQLKAKNKLILTDVIQKSIDIKSNIVASDETEKNKREILNFGHTIAHALETVTQHTITHGQAVYIGMLIESDLSHQMGLLSRVQLERIQNLIAQFNVPLQSSIHFSKDDFFRALSLDKKTRNHQPRFVLLNEIGKVLCHDNRYSHEVNQEIILCSSLSLLSHPLKN